MYDLDRYTVRSGKIIGEDGKAHNIVTIVNSISQVPAEPVNDKVYAVESYQPAGGRVLGEDGKAYNVVDLLQAIGIGGGGGSGLMLGETAFSAYRGDRGKTAFDHSQITIGNPHGTTKADLGLGNADDTSDADKPISTKTQAALDALASLIQPTEPSDLLRYKHEQTEPVITWNIQHNFGQKYANVKILDDHGDETFGFVDYPNSTANLLVIQFANPLAGTAYVTY